MNLDLWSEIILDQRKEMNLDQWSETILDHLEDSTFRPLNAFQVHVAMRCKYLSQDLRARVEVRVRVGNRVRVRARFSDNCRVRFRDMFRCQG